MARKASIQTKKDRRTQDTTQIYNKQHEGWMSCNMDPRQLGSKKIDGLHMPPGKAYTTDWPSENLLTAQKAYAGFKWFQVKTINTDTE